MGNQGERPRKIEDHLFNIKCPTALLKYSTRPVVHCLLLIMNIFIEIINT